MVNGTEGVTSDTEERERTV